MTYPYSGRDLFTETETYFFAECTNADYLDSWRRSRATFRRSLSRAVAPSPVVVKCPPDGFMLIDLLNKTIEQNDKTAATIIYPFVVKYEVHKRLFDTYLPSTKRHPLSSPASLGTYVAFSEALLRQAATGQLNYLSTLLKLCDAMASQPSERYSSEEASRLEAVLAAEDNMVKEREPAS